LLTKSLLETKTSNPLILLDEIDKVISYKGNSAIHACLSNFLDPLHNKEILDHYLDVKLDFSQATFVITANDSKKIPNYLLSRASLIVELSEYNFEQKKEISNLFIQEWFEKNTDFNPNNLEITSKALTALINKTNEKGVRQLKSALENIFDHCILQRTEEAEEEKVESRIRITSELVNEIIPRDFFNIDSEDNDSISESKNNLKTLQNWESEKKEKGEILPKFKPKKSNAISTKDENEKKYYQIEIEKLKEQFKKSQKESAIKEKIMFFSVIGFLIIWGVYGIIKLLKLLRNNK
jgi:Lon-like ATP-dependent protease